MQKRIKAAFERLGIDIEKWVACGSDHGIHYKKDDYFSKCFSDREYPPLVKRCICNANIKENCYITTEDFNYDNIVVVGNCCFKEFSTGKLIKCIVCDQDHSNFTGKHKEICNNCKKDKIITKKLINRHNKKIIRDFNKSVDNLLLKYSLDLDAVFKEYCYDLAKIYPIFIQEERDIIKYLNYKKRNRLDEYYRIKNMKASAKLLNQYKDHMQLQLEGLNNEYKPVFNGVKLLNKYLKYLIKKDSKGNLHNRKIIFKYTEDYNIACFYENNKHVYTMNLKTGLPTKKSPSQIKINL